MITKWEISVEFRGHKVPKSDIDGTYYNTMYSGGLCETLEEAVHKGNELVNKLRGHFTLHDYFEIKGLFGCPTTLVTNCCTSDKVQVFIKLNPLRVINDDELLVAAKEVINFDNDYRKWKSDQ